MASESDIQRLLAGLKSMSHEDMAKTLALLDELEARKRRTLAQRDFLAFIAAVDPNYKFGAHLKRLGNLLMQVEEGQKDRVAVSMAPRFGKSMMISIYFPAWYLGSHPDHKIIMASHTSDLAIDMARKVRNLMQTAEYKNIFPGVNIAADAKAAGKWDTVKGGTMFAVGVGGAIAGRGADIIVVDDPLSEQDLKAGNTASLDTVYEWFRAGLRTRLMPGGKIVALHCLTGDTAVTMSDGSQTPIKDVRPGDRVLGYVDGEFRSAKVLGWSNQGLDRIYSLVLRSGVIIRGNERHPFLVDFNGGREWVKIKDLRVGMRLVSATGVHVCPTLRQSAACAKSVTTGSGGTRGPQDGFLSRVKNRCLSALQKDALSRPNQRQSPGCVCAAERVSGTTRSIQRQKLSPWDITDGGKVSVVLRLIAARLSWLRVYVPHAETKRSMQSEKPQGRITARKPVVEHILRLGMASRATTTTVCSPVRVGNALYAGSLLTTVTPPASGKPEGWQSIIATIRDVFARCFATSATFWSKNETLSSGSDKPSSTLSVTLDELVAITPDGVEEVFDLQVEGAENFLANGVVSHNTRWHQRDLIGRLLKDGAMNPDGDVYEMFEFPAILTSPNPDYDPEDPDSTPELQKSLWPEQWSLESLLRTKASMPAWQWNAQYQQNPTAQEAAIIKRDQIKWWTKEDPPTCDFIVQSYDTALTTKERSDYSVCQTWGVFTDDNGVSNAVLLNRVKGKWEFPELKRMAHEQYEEWQPDSVIVEAKASGQPLIDEMRRSGIFVQDFSPGKGQDKIARLNAVADMFASGQVWFPETWWASEVVEEIVAFPSGEHDDDVDAMTLGLARIRKGGLIRLSTDREDPDTVQGFRRRAAYY